MMPPTDVGGDEYLVFMAYTDLPYMPIDRPERVNLNHQRSGEFGNGILVEDSQHARLRFDT